ncbi:MAG: tetratricopeptide repeat protein [Phycisphaerales bacterium]|nr:tetratricopeptide repeat protein [Phycisphaerales bacterium]
MPATITPKLAEVITIKDVREHSDSLWKSAHCYEKAQLWRKAIDVLLQFAKAMPGDPRQLEALHRLGMAHLADRQYAVAVEFFRRILEENPRSPTAHQSHVPLARSLMALNRLDEAMIELQRVVTDHPALKPDSVEYRAALVELGRLHYRQRQFEAAIQRLNEADERYGQATEGATIRFLMADSYRQSVPQIEETLKQQLPLSRRQALAAERARRLDRAQSLYGQVVTELDARKPASMSEAEKLYRRNAYFYRADCAYDLGKYDQAITLYDAAVKHFDADPSSLMALVQIVNAYCEMGRLDEARVANDRARAQLKRIPKEAFDDPSLPMNRQHWEDWLKFTSQFNLFSAAQADAGNRRTQ